MPEHELDLALGDAARVLLDSSALIAFHSTQQQTHALARHILARVQDPHDRLIAYYSAVTAMESPVSQSRSPPSMARFAAWECRFALSDSRSPACERRSALWSRRLADKPQQMG